MTLQFGLSFSRRETAGNVGNVPRLELEPYGTTRSANICSEQRLKDRHRLDLCSQEDAYCNETRLFFTKLSKPRLGLRHDTGSNGSIETIPNITFRG
jgi:hypothetical protein